MCKRGEVYYVALPVQTGNSSIQAGIRPAVIVQNDIGNKFSPTLIIVPLTTSLKNTNQPTHVVIDSSVGLERTSMILAEQFTTINKFDIRGELICTIPETYMKQIDKAIRISLGIKELADEEYVMSILRDIKQLERDIKTAARDEKLVMNGNRQGLMNVLKRYCDKYGIDYMKFVQLIQKEETTKQIQMCRVG
jgi:mRNA interferase MazF